MKLAYVKNLQDQINMPYSKALLLCTICGSEFSANKGDYWQLSNDDSIKCCNIIMRLKVLASLFIEETETPKYRKIPVHGMGVLTEEYLFLDYKQPLERR